MKKVWMIVEDIRFLKACICLWGPSPLFLAHAALEQSGAALQNETRLWELLRATSLKAARILELLFATLEPSKKCATVHALFIEPSPPQVASRL